MNNEDIAVTPWRISRNPVEGRFVDHRVIDGIEVVLYEREGYLEWRVLEPVHPVPIQSVILRRVEGPLLDCVVKTVKGFEGANRQFWEWGKSAPRQTRTMGGYHKVDFEIIWTDGTQYYGRFDMVYGGFESCGHDLQMSMRYRLRYFAGLAPRLSPDYPNLVGTKRMKTITTAVRHILACCDI